MKIFVGYLCCKRPLTKPMHRIEDKIKMLTYFRLMKVYE